MERYILGGAEIIVVRDKKEAVFLASGLIKSQIKLNKKTVLGLATGNTMVPLYQKLISMYLSKEIDFSDVKTFNLDEYYGISSLHPSSLRSYMEDRFFSRVNLKRKNIEFLDGSKIDWKNEAKRYERSISESGGIDLQVLGLGVNGHIGFNEPGSKKSSKTRIVKLSKEIYNIHKKNFKKGEAPDYGFTVGVSDILDSKKIILIATGKSKSKAVEKMVIGPISSEVPASFIRSHSDVKIILDRPASRLIRSRFNKV